MVYVFATLYLLFLFGLEFGFFAVFPLGGSVPNMLLLGLLGLLITMDDIAVMLYVALIGGLLWDVYSGFPPGTYTVGFLIVGTVLFFLNEHVVFFQERLKYLPLLLLIGHTILEGWTILYGWGLGAMHLSSLVIHPLYWLTVSLYRLCYHALLLYPVYFFAVLLDNSVRAWVRRSGVK